jgi:hypothetical protein
MILVVSKEPVAISMPSCIPASLEPVVRMTGGRIAGKWLETHQPTFILMDLSQDEAAILELLDQLFQCPNFVPILMVIPPVSQANPITGDNGGQSFWIEVLSQSWESRLEEFLHMAGVQGPLPLAGYILKHEAKFVLGNNQALLTPLVPVLQAILVHAGKCPLPEAVQVGLALREATINGMVHGNLEVSSRIMDENPDSFFAQIELRRQQPPYQDRRIYLEANLEPGKVIFQLRDEGPGFDTTALPDPLDPSNLEKGNGRGILLIRTFMDDVFFNEKGNEITMVKFISLEETACGS